MPSARPELEGIPQLGSGPIFPVELLPALIKSFDHTTCPPGRDGASASTSGLRAGLLP